MNYFKKLLLIFFLFFLLTSPSTSNEKIAFVDMDYIIQNSNIGKIMITNINKLDKKNIEDLNKKNKILKDLELAIQKKKNVISEEAFKEEVISYRKKLQEFTNEKNQIVRDFNNFKKKELEKIFKKMSPIISDYIEENSIKILFDSKNVFMGVKSSNLTDDILNKINTKLK